MARWTIVLESRATDGSDVVGVRKVLKAALRCHGLRCVDYDRVRVYRDGAERREALAGYLKAELAKRVDGNVLWRYFPYDHPSIRILGEPGRDTFREERWRAKLSCAPPAKARSKVHYGDSLLAGEKIWGSLDDDVQVELLERFDDAIAVETESAGVARAVFSARCELSHNLQFAIVRGISDLVDRSGNQRSRERWRRYAASAAAAFVHDLVERLLSEPQPSTAVPVEII